MEEIIDWVVETQRATNLTGKDKLMFGKDATGETLHLLLEDLYAWFGGSVGFVNRGNWVPGTYNPGDYVFAESSTNPGAKSMYFLIGMMDYESSIEPKDDLTHWAEFEAPAGPQGPKGDPGEKGDPFLYEDFTPEQLADLKGAKGDKGDMPAHQWSGTSLQFEMPNGEWGTAVNLKGDKGDQGERGIQGIQGVRGEKGDKPAHQWSGTSLRFENPNGSWGPYVNLIGPQGIQGEKGEMGDGLHFDETGPISGRSAYDSAAPGFVYLADDEGKFYVRLNPTGWSQGVDIGAVTQTLSQPAIGQLAISGGNTINLNTVNMSGNQTGIAGNKTWTGEQSFGNYVSIDLGGDAAARLHLKRGGVHRWGFYLGGETDPMSTGQQGGDFELFAFNNQGLFLGSRLSVSRSGTVTIPNLSGTGNDIVGVNASGMLTRNNPNDLGLVPYTGATQDVNLGSNRFFSNYVYLNGSASNSGSLWFRNTGIDRWRLFEDSNNLYISSYNQDGFLKQNLTLHPDGTTVLHALAGTGIRLIVANSGGGLSSLTGTPGQLPFTNSAGTGVEMRKISPADLSLSTAGTILGNIGGSLSGITLSNSATNNTAAQRTATGQLKASDAVDNDDLVTLSQVNTRFSNLSNVASSGDYNDLSNKPSLGTASTKNVGTSAGNVVEVQPNGKIDPSLYETGGVGRVVSLLTSNLTLSAGDNGKVFVNDSATQRIITIPLNSTVGLPIGFSVDIACPLSRVSFSWPSGVVIVGLNGAGASNLVEVGMAGNLTKIGTNRWILIGGN